MMKMWAAVFAVFLVSVSFGGVLSAQTTVGLTQSDSQGLFWDAGNAQWGGSSLQIYQAFLPNEPTQAFLWTQVPNGWTICNSTVCLSDNGQQVVMGTHADTWVITNQGAVQNVGTQRYIEQPANPGNGSYLTTGTTPFTWNFAFASAGNSGSSASYGIMPLGDSITQGYSQDLAAVAGGGYRCPLASLLANAAVNFSFVGDSQASVNPGGVTACSQNEWEGHGGYTFSQLQAFEDADGSVRTSQPKIILLLAGTNDVNQGATSNIPANLSALLTDLFAQDPNAWIIVSSIPAMNPSAPQAPSGEAGWSAQVPFANAEIKATAALFQRTSFVDFYSAVVNNVNLYIGPDGVHPTAAGYGVLANLWEVAIKTYVTYGN